MSLSATLFAFASGLAARVSKPKDYANADVEITKLRKELAHARAQIDVMRLALMEARRDNVRREIIPFGGQSWHGAQLAALAQQAQRQTQNFQAQDFCNCVPSRGQVWGAMAGPQRLPE